eukprot:CFRG2395T1
MTFIAGKRIAVVTGANQGIGFEIALLIARKGFTTILACRREHEGNKAADKLREEGFDAQCMVLDIGDKESVKLFVTEMESKFQHCDVFVNNAAIAFKAKDPTPFIGQARPTIHINFHGTLNVIQSIEPLMRKSADPRVVTVASQAGMLRIVKNPELRALFSDKDNTLTVPKLSELMDKYVTEAESHGEQNSISNTNYGMSKCGITALVRLLSKKELARSESEPGSCINYSCFCPGYCSTSMSSYKGYRSAEKGAQTGVWLATRDATPLENSGKFYYDMKEVNWDA